MVLSLIALAATVPLIATSTLSLQDQAQRQQDQHGSGASESWRTLKHHLKVRASARAPFDERMLFMTARVVLRDGFLYVEVEPWDESPLHPFTGYFLPYPEKGYDGLVTTISKDPPMLNWVYLDPVSLRIRHGTRAVADSDDNVTGPFDVKTVSATGDRCTTLEGWQGFIATETDEPGLWALMFDRNDDGLKGKVDSRFRTVEIELVREQIEGDEPQVSVTRTAASS
ncbi:hypothetical protein W97_04233 [Coniosporium apollinis CBS 100218]|uniref:Uncharacterized protein n=1 Tax=Coniosporium apollinis (strain CBS 100218) TaxID=1168221 RepID=R7YT37_CONA1|nr:uncharacterized protein W97_04233 [Coniosporium apollinis CBS 100218]EON64998.1 hypothetical protein W97_04233 [Coniosporium apollinis CBS 100218]